jgi:DNA-binding response OmpR family regulator
MKNILLVEDDINLKESIKNILTNEGFKVVIASTLKEAVLQMNNDINLVVMDWMLPDGQGIDLLRELRKKYNTPVIMLTARTDLIDKVLGLETGANDYITKPFEVRELIARIRVQLRDLSSTASTSESIVLGDLSLNPQTREVIYANNKNVFTKMEFDLLKLLVENPKQTFSRESLLDKVWGYENYPTTRTVDNHVLQIRQKTSEHIIETIRGLGYRLGELTRK